MKLKRKTVLLLVVLSLLCISLIVGVSYSIYQLDQKQTTPNIIQVGCFTIEFEDYGTDSSTYTNLSLTNSYPISTNTALNETPYKFKITNTCDYIAKTNIAVNVLKTSSISNLATTQGKSIGDMIDISIKEGSNNTSAPVLLSSLNKGTIRSGDNETEESYIIRTEYLEKDVPKTYSLWMWVPETINNIEVGNEAQGLTLYSKIDVYSLAVEEEAVAAAPELYQGLIPVEYDSNGNTVVADANDTSWYDYDNHKWGNAILGTASARSKSLGQILNDEEILQYYVWIPRYRYQLFNAVAGASADEQMINIEFETKDTPKSNGIRNGEWLTHPAFTFGDTELNGIWVGKFEPSIVDSNEINYINILPNSLDCSSENCTNSQYIRILPNNISLTYNNVSNSFYASKSIKNTSIFGLNANQIDTHMMKNLEWGVVAYLSNSKYGLYKSNKICFNTNQSTLNGCGVFINNINVGYGSDLTHDVTMGWGPTVTGCSANNTNSGVINTHNQTNPTCLNNYDWNHNGILASTTGNIYGIYDMSGGSNELVMGNQSSSTEDYAWYPKSSGFASQPDSKYFNQYLASINDESEETERLDQSRGLLGDATREIMKNYGNSRGGWFGDFTNFFSKTYPWIVRGGHAPYGADAGIFYFSRSSGGADTVASFRIVLTAEGN